MKQLPLPVRVAAGLAVSAVDRARTLPGRLAELPVTVVSQALQLSMRVQQQVTELAIKGDDALSTFRPAEESPEWATFDEDTDRYDATASNAYNGRSKFESIVDADDEDEAGEVDVADALVELGSSTTPETDETPETGGTAGAGKAPDADNLGDVAAEHTDVAELAGEAEEAAVELDIVPAEQVEEEAAAASADGPAALPNYAELSLPQLRARMRRLGIAELNELVEFERAHENRPDFVGMLTRRISTVRAQR